MMLIGEGLSTRAVAERLTVSVRTVEGHIYNAMAKTGTSSRDELAALLPTHHATQQDPARPKRRPDAVDGKNSSPLVVMSNGHGFPAVAARPNLSMRTVDGNTYRGSPTTRAGRPRRVHHVAAGEADNPVNYRRADGIRVRESFLLPCTSADSTRRSGAGAPGTR